MYRIFLIEPFKSGDVCLDHELTILEGNKERDVLAPAVILKGCVAVNATTHCGPHIKEHRCRSAFTRIRRRIAAARWGKSICYSIALL